MKRLFLALACVVSLGSCATFLQPSGEAESARLAERVNTGTAETLAGQSASPFLLDQEIVPIKADVATFWKALKDSGIRLSGTREPSLKVSAEAYRAFAETFETKVFFKKYVPKDARIVILAAPAGKKVLLLVADELFATRIYGFKGPF